MLTRSALVAQEPRGLARAALDNVAFTWLRHGTWRLEYPVADRYRRSRSIRFSVVPSTVKVQIIVRIIVDDPPPGVRFAVQRGRTELLFSASTDILFFEFPLTVADLQSEPPRLTGPFAQGPPSKRFVYVNSGEMAGQSGSCWSRRAKVPVYTIARSVIGKAAADSGRLIEGRIHGRSKDGGPACATVKLENGWRLVETTS